MAGKVDFGNNSDITFGCISHNILDFFLGIEAAIGLAVILARVMADNSLLAVGTDSSQFRTFLDFDAPALVVGKMPMQAIHIVQALHVDELLHLIYRKEMAAHVEVDTAIAETGSIGNLYRSQFGRTVGHPRDGLAQRLYPIEHTGLAATADNHTTTRHLQGISFGLRGIRSQLQQDVTFTFGTGFELISPTGGFVQICCQPLSIAPHSVITFGIDDFHTTAKGKSPFGSLRHLQRNRNDGIVCLNHLSGTRGEQAHYGSASCHLQEILHYYFSIIDNECLKLGIASKMTIQKRTYNIQYYSNLMIQTSIDYRYRLRLPACDETDTHIGVGISSFLARESHV